MRKCQNCQASFSPLARFCAHCGKKATLDLPALRESAEKPLHHKINPSKKRKGLASLAFALFVLTIVLVVVLMTVSILMGDVFAGFLFMIGAICLLFYFKERSLSLHSLLKRETKNRCLNCGYRFAGEEKFCEQCGRPLV